MTRNSSTRSGPGQRLDQLGAADHVHVIAVFLLQRAHRVGDVALEQRRVLPAERLAERRRRHVLRLRVQRLCDHLLLLRRVRPVGREDLVGAAPEQEAARLDDAPERPPPGGLVLLWRMFQPPCLKPPLVSSSAAPGACTTPSRLMNS